MASQRELVEQLFEAALSLAPMERDAFLEEKCSSNLQLKRIVEDLLAEHVRAGSFLQHLPLDFLDKAMMNTASIAEMASPVDSNGTPLFPTAVGRLKPGQTLIDRFVIVRFIAKGGMGEVYEAEDRFLQGVHVALKTILRDIADDPASQKRFEREVLLAREVTHSNLCPIYDIFHCEQQGSHFLFLTMKLLPGENLAVRLQTAIPIPAGEGMTILKQLAAGLAAIHAAGIIHRDIKPNNIMLDGSGQDLRLWITDFGLARAHEAENTLPGKEVLAGTPGYIAPELIAGQPPSQATDLFAFGVVLHQVFTGQKPIVRADNSTMTVSPRLNASGLPSPFIQLIKGCLDLDPQRRCQSFEHALVVLQLRRRTTKLWTRRQFAGTAAAAVCALAGGAWWEREEIYHFLHPLPGKRFVALLNWPKTSDSQVAPMLTGALSAIKSGLARMEAFDRNLLVISPEDAHQEVSAAAPLREVCDPLGANLVLAASGLRGSKHFQLFLRLLDPLSDRPLREKELSCALAEITSLPGKAVQAAASLLDLGRYLRGPRMAPETPSIASFTAFQTAESLMKQPNHTGLDAAIDKYKQAVQLDPHYAVAHARLALAFVRLYTLRHDSAALDHARGNCHEALTLAPRLVDSHLALALVLQQTGNAQGALDESAKALALDPSNPNTLMWQARIYARLNRWADAERTFQRVLKERPNFWCAYSELGLVLHSEGKVQASIKAYRAASVAAPRSSSALSDLGAEYLLVGEFAEATESFRKSMVLDPDSDQAAVNTSLGLRCQGKYEEALLFALKSVELNPAADINWLELADCYSQLSGRQREAKGAYLRAAEEAERHLRTDPIDGPSWMLLALYKIKSGNPQNATSFIKKAESLGANDADSQLYKVRILELLGKREDALATLADCFRKGATAFEMAPFPDMRSLRKDPRYWAIVQSKSARTETTQLPDVETF
jgi:tetratricopeptide (TPR) repeat protein